MTGLTLPIQHFFPIPAYVDMACRAEELGYDTVWIPEVVGPDVFALSAAIAARTTRIGLAGGVQPVQIRTPVTYAFSAATVDALAPGRAILGLGTSSPIIVGAWHGLPYEAPLSTMREAVEVIRAVFSGEKTDIAGARIASKGFRMAMRPQRLPIYLGALNTAMLRLAGEVADGVLLNWVNADAIAAKVAAVHEGARAAGRDPASIDIACYVRTCVTDDPGPTREVLRRELTGYVPVPTYRKQFIAAGFADECAAVLERWEAGDRRGSVAGISDRMVDEINAIGDVETCRTRLQGFRDAGVTNLIVAPWSGGTDPAADAVRTMETLAPVAG